MGRLHEQFMMPLINAFGRQLEEINLHLRLHHNDLFTVDFSKLQRLTLDAPIQTYDAILKTAVNLKSIKIRNKTVALSPSDNEKILIKCFSASKSLESIMFDDYQ